MGKNRQLSRLLDEQGINQRELAERIGVTTVTVSRWMNGWKLGRLSAEKIHAAFPDYPVAYLLGIDNTEIDELKRLVVEMWHELNYQSVRAESGYNRCVDRMSAFDRRIMALGIEVVGE